MKKQRPHQASKAARRARKGRQRAAAVSATTALAQRDQSPALTPKSRTHASPPAWQWHQAASGNNAAPGKPAKGPPPKSATSKTTAAPPPAKSEMRRDTKLSAALLARLQRPLAPAEPLVAPIILARRHLAAQWRTNRRAAVTLLLPAVMTVALLAAPPRTQKSDQVPQATASLRPALPQSKRPQMPAMSVASHAAQTAIPRVIMADASPVPPTPDYTSSERDRIVAALARGIAGHKSAIPQSPYQVALAHQSRPPDTPPMSVAPFALPVEEPPSIVAAGPPFVRPPERLASVIPAAKHDLDLAIASLALDAKRAAALAALPPYTRQPERLASVVPAAKHDLEVAIAVLALDASRAAALAALPPYARPAERAAATVPQAMHDLANIASLLARDAAAARKPFVRPAEGLIAALPATVEPPYVRPAEQQQTALPPQAIAPEQVCRASADVLSPRPRGRSTVPVSADAGISDDPQRFGLALANAAIAQTRELVIYNANYTTIAYPRGDVPLQFGVCTDVVIRAYRALDIDLQELVHLSRPGNSDKNIDHRRTELLRKFFATHGEQLSVSPYVEDYLPGDIVTYYRPQNRSSTAHIAIVTDVIAPSGRPMIVHNRGWGVQLEDALFVDQMTGHYRFRAPAAALVAQAAPTTQKLTAAATPMTALAVSHEGVRPAHTATAVRVASAKSQLPPTGRRMALGVGAQEPPVPARCDPSAAAAKSCRPATIR